MTTPSPQTLDIQEVPRLLSKHSRLLIMGTLLGCLLLTIASFILPMRYKAHFVFTIYTKYFQSPLIGDFVPGLGVSEFEARSQRESLIRQTLTPEFLDSLGTKYGIYSSTSTKAATTPIQIFRKQIKDKFVEYGLYQPPAVDSKLASERQKMLARIDIFSLNNTTFNIGFSYSNPRVTFQVTQDLYSQIIKGLLDIRTNLLLNVRDAIKKKLESLSTNGQNPTSRGPIQEELKTVQEQLRALRALYTDAHPKVQELRDREQALKSELSVLPADSAGTAAISDTPEEDASSLRDIASDLSRKLNYLDIAIDSDKQHHDDYFASLESPQYPNAPSGPGKGIIVLGGLILGFICSIFIAAIREYFEYTALRASALAQRLGLPILGELPPFPQYASMSKNAPPGTKPQKPDGSS